MLYAWRVRMRATMTTDRISNGTDAGGADTMQNRRIKTLFFTSDFNENRFAHFLFSIHLCDGFQNHFSNVLKGCGADSISRLPACRVCVCVRYGVRGTGYVSI